MFYNLFNEANMILSDKDIEYKLDEWKRKPNKNVLLITGLSGGGKTTLAYDMAEKHNAKVLQMDNFDFFDYINDETGIIKKFLLKRNIDLSEVDIEIPIWEIKNLDYDACVSDFYKFAIEAFHRDHKNLYIIEGLQPYAYIPHEYSKGLPMIVKGTSYMVSQYKRIMRDRGESSFISNLMAELKTYGLSILKVNKKDAGILKRFTKTIIKESNNMFYNLLTEATSVPSSNPDSYYLPGDGGKIQAFEDAFGSDEIKKSIAYGFSSSHEYDEPERKKAAVKSCITFVNNYKWEKRKHKVEDIECFDKPLNQKKVLDIAGTFTEEGIKDPLIVVDKIHGFNWQSKGKSILLDGNHRLGAMREIKTKHTPTYHGTYTGDAEKDHSEFLPDDANLITESAGNFSTNVKDFLIEGTAEFNLLTEASKKRKKIKIERVELTSAEREEVKSKYGDTECSFAKDGISGKYYCYTHRCRSELFDRPTDIPMDRVRFVSSTS